jgi:hypothetical protein
VITASYIFEIYAKRRKEEENVDPYSNLTQPCLYIVQSCLTAWILDFLKIIFVLPRSIANKIRPVIFDV